MSLFVSRVSFCYYCLINMSVFAVFPEVVDLLCKLPCGVMVQKPGPISISQDHWNRIDLPGVPLTPYERVVWGLGCEDSEKWEHILKQLSDRKSERLFKCVSKWCSLSNTSEPFLTKRDKMLFTLNYVAIRQDRVYFFHCAKVLFRLRQKKALLRLLSLASTTNSMMMRRRTQRAMGDTDDSIPRLEPLQDNVLSRDLVCIVCNGGDITAVSRQGSLAKPLSILFLTPIISLA